MPLNTEAPALSAVPSTLRIPLAARALGGTLFPQMAVEDRYAADALARMGDDGQQWLRDRQSVYGTLGRTRRFRNQALEFLACYPDAQVANLGCGLSDYLQWIDNGRMRMTDADLPEVMTIRREILPSRHARHVLAELDLTAPDWWQRLGLPASRDDRPVFLMSEGVFMYLKPATVSAVLATFGERAPAGSIFTFDAMCWLGVGRARHHTSVKHTDAEFHWGPRKLADLTAPHPRLTLQSVHQVMGGYSLFYKLLQPTFKAITGVPFYAVYTLGGSRETTS
ncbi:MAG: class I SAM-dependent methyltransferase [Lautropia sp.]